MDPATRNTHPPSLANSTSYELGGDCALGRRFTRLPTALCGRCVALPVACAHTHAREDPRAVVWRARALFLLFSLFDVLARCRHCRHIPSKGIFRRLGPTATTTPTTTTTTEDDPHARTTLAGRMMHPSLSRSFSFFRSNILARCHFPLG